MAIHLAMEKSMRTHKEEERKRQAEEQVRELARRKEQEAENNRQILREQEEIQLLAQLAEAVDDEEDLNLPEADGETFKMDADIEAELLEMDCDLVDVPSATREPRASGGRDTEGHQAVVPPTGLDNVEERARTCMASQETDYGDLDVTIEDLDEYF
jgi:pyruvate-formate lyase